MASPVPLDPQTQTMLDQVAVLDAPPVHEQPVDDQRDAYHFLGGLGSPPATVEATDRTVPGPGGGDLPVRVYRPLADPPAGGLVFFHAGGFVIGDLETHDSACRLLADAAEAVVVAVDYRRAPEHPFPAAHDDAAAATGWVARHAGELGFDPDRLAVGGDSAGGNLAASMALRARDTGGEPAVAAQLLVCPWVDLACDRPSMAEFADGYLLTRASLEQWRSWYAPDPATWGDAALSPLAADAVGVAPAVVVTVGYDPLRDQGRAYAEHLRAAGVDVRHLHHPDLVHPFPQITAVSERSRQALEEAGEALAALLRS